MSEKGYRENRWNGLPHFECQKCPFDTLDEAAMVAHVETHEPPKTRPIHPQVLAVDRFGNPITEIEVSDGQNEPD